MSDTKITKILMDISREETKIADAYLHKAAMFRALAAEIDIPDSQPKPATSPKPTPKPSDKAEVKPDSRDDEYEIMKVLEKWQEILKGISGRDRSWPFLM